MNVIHKNLKDYSSAPFEILIGVLTFAPVVVLIVFYPQLSSRVPVFLNWSGEVEVWAPKSLASVLRVPAMAIDLQLICLLMKLGAVKSQRGVLEADTYQEKVTTLSAQLWDWLRCLIAFKMAAESLDLLFRSVESLRFLMTPARILTWTTAVVSILAAGLYGYRLWQIKRKKGVPEIAIEQKKARAQVVGGFIYFNPADPALFVESYLLNFGNKWVYLLILSLVAYPLIVFLPA